MLAGSALTRAFKAAWLPVNQNCRRLDRFVGSPTIALCSIDLSTLSSFSLSFSLSEFLAQPKARFRLAPRASTSHPITRFA
jgi:hypothetical protein